MALAEDWEEPARGSVITKSATEERALIGVREKLNAAFRNRDLNPDKGCDFRLSGRPDCVTVHYLDGTERQRVFVPGVDVKVLAQVIAELNAKSQRYGTLHLPTTARGSGTAAQGYRLG